jgi:hypothetical protein
MMKTVFHSLFAIAMLLGLVSSVAANIKRFDWPVTEDPDAYGSSAACSRKSLR